MKKLINKVGIFLVGSALVSTLTPFSPAVSAPVKNTQKRLTKVTSQTIPVIKQKGMLISQNLDTSLEGKWTGVLTPASNSCLGVYLPNQIRVNLTVRILGDTVEIIDGSQVYRGELTNNGRNAQARMRLANGVYTWFLWNRIGNRASLGFAHQSDYGCIWLYYGEANFQSS
jgi:hypothetical protein